MTRAALLLVRDLMRFVELICSSRTIGAARTRVSVLASGAACTAARDAQARLLADVALTVARSARHHIPQGHRTAAKPILASLVTSTRLEQRAASSLAAHSRCTVRAAQSEA